MKKFLSKVNLAISVVIYSCSAYGFEYSSQDYWGFYLKGCEQLIAANAEVQKQINEGAEGLFDAQITFGLERMASTISKVSTQDRVPEKLLECEKAATTATNLLREAEAYNKNIEKKLDVEARKDHEASPFHERAKSTGFKDYSWLSTLDSDYKVMGGKKLQSVMFLVDGDCGVHYRAIQRVDQYVLFAPSNVRNSMCSGREKVAVIPAKGFKFNRGDFIDIASYYVFVGTLKGETMDGFPTKVLVVKQVPAKWLCKPDEDDCEN